MTDKEIQELHDTVFATIEILVKQGKHTTAAGLLGEMGYKLVPIDYPGYVAYTVVSRDSMGKDPATALKDFVRKWKYERAINAS